MRKLMMLGVVAAGLLGSNAEASAQGMFPLGLEVRGGAAFPTGEFKQSLNAETGVSYGVNATLQAIPMLGIYAGYERAEFGVDDAAGLGDADLIDQGFAFGAKISLPLGMAGLGPWVRAGGIYNQLSRDGETAAGNFKDERKLGFEVGGGLSIPLGMVVSVTPGVRYRNYSSDRMVGGENMNVSYIVGDLGLSFSF